MSNQTYTVIAVTKRFIIMRDEHGTRHKFFDSSAETKQRMKVGQAVKLEDLLHA